MMSLWIVLTIAHWAFCVTVIERTCNRLERLTLNSRRPRTITEALFGRKNDPWPLRDSPRAEKAHKQ